MDFTLLPSPCVIGMVTDFLEIFILRPQLTPIILTNFFGF